MFPLFESIKEYLFIADLIVLYVMLVGVMWSVGFPNKRIWPPPQKRSWQYRVTWALFYLALLISASFILTDWNSWIFTTNSRFLLGFPLALIGAALVSWGFYSLGSKNTSGQKDGFKTTGPYRFTRNPQYLGDMLLFLGFVLISNSLYVLITHLLLIIVFAITSLAEEDWLDETYKKEYRDYKYITPRFL